MLHKFIYTLHCSNRVAHFLRLFFIALGYAPDEKKMKEILAKLENGKCHLSM